MNTKLDVPNKQPKRNLVHVFVAAGVGSALEFYDFVIYGLAAALVFNKVFFPTLDPLNGTLVALASFGAGFVARPLGGIVFGHIGDRYGRKPVLLATLLMVGAGTFLIGCVPSYDDWGIWAPIVVVTLRILQGFGAGAEYGGAVLFLVENAPGGKRGLYASIAPLGVTAGRLMAAGVFAACSTLPADQFVAWGWRVPFLLSVVLVVLGLYVRAKLHETPIFEEIKKKRVVRRSPVFNAIMTQPRSFLVVLGAQIGPNGIGQLIPIFGLSYVAVTLGVPKNTVLTGMSVAECVSLVTIPLFAMLSDRIGRKPVYMGAAIFAALFAYPFFILVNTKEVYFIWAAFILMIGIGFAGMFGTQASYYAELFRAESRFSGFAFAREIGTLLAGAPGPVISTALLAWAGGQPWYVAGYMVLLCLLTVVALTFGPETYKSDIGVEASIKEEPRVATENSLVDASRSN